MPYIARTENNGKPSDWLVVNAIAESSAKRVLSNQYSSQCVHISLAFRDDTGNVKLIAKKHSLQKEWTNF